MKLWVLAGIMSAAMIAPAFAEETTEECQIDETRREARDRTDAPSTATTVARPTVATREVDATPRIVTPQRRRNGKPIPDAELIGPRGAL